MEVDPKYEHIVRSITRTCRGPLLDGVDVLIRQALENQNFDLAKSLDTQRQPCGNDINDEILMFPFDGQEHTINCHKCDVERSFRSPKFT